ncbi:MAG: efflux RND transporter permease subunit [Xanthomonadales bacterium]|nr:efflux RND transporter permease subunit [Xanthomonadales bacterium]MDZ4115903.1 efflux RND transporter permease subunit [Xanthomonadaceae bacterium]MDZ4377830.1 efflux RND transporter permease subunit [Xanthomonadaceae bacterium]
MSLVTFSTRRRVTVAMFTVTLVLFGFLALRELKVNLLPDLSYPTLTVRTEYVGAAPSEIENLVTEPIEESVGVVKNLSKLHSVSRTGQSDVILEFAWGADMDKASIEVRDKLESVQLPLEAKKSVLLRFNPSTEPIMRLALSGESKVEGVDEALLKRLRRYGEEELKKRLEPIAGVAAVKVSGGLEDEIQVDIDQQALARLNLSVGTVIDRLRQENVNISGGRLEEGTQRYLVRTINQFVDLEQMRNLLVVNRDGYSIYLRDIATVGQGFKERQAIIRLDGSEAIELAIYKEGDANTVDVADRIKAALKQLESDLPADAILTQVDDQSVFIRQALDEVRSEALLGGALAILLIFFFLRDGWSTFVIGLSLPISIITTFFVMGQFGINLNVMSLAGLALATGMVVDDSIVVLESIAKARERGLSLLDAAVKGTQEVSMAVVASTLTTVAVFLPLVFVEGVAGQLFRDQALTVAIAMIISLLVSLTLIPMLSSVRASAPLGFASEPEPDHAAGLTKNPLLRPVERGMGGIGWLLRKLFGGLLFAITWLITLLARVLRASVGRALGWVGEQLMKGYDVAANGYAHILPSALARPTLVLGSAAAAFVFALALIPTLGMDLIPQLAQDRFDLTVKLPSGTQLRDTDALIREVQRKHAGDPGVRVLYAVSGSGTRLDANPTESGENVGKLSVILERGAPRATEAEEIERLRATMASYPGAEAKFGRPELFSFSTPLEIEIRGTDLAQLESAGRDLVQRLESIDRFADVKSSVEDGFPEIQIRFDQERAAALGLTTRQIADQVVRKVRGEVATRYSFRDRKIDVLVRAREQDRSSVADIGNLIVNPESDRPVTLSSVAEVVNTLGTSEIHRVDQVRVAIISAALRYGDLGSAVNTIERMLAEKPLAGGVRVHIGGQGEELDASTRSLIFAFGLAIFLVYLVMASQFESLLHPFVILFSIPLAVVGAVLALKLTGNSLSVVVFIGLILLAGIVVKNAIVLIDLVNQLREAGRPKAEAIIEACSARLRPIIMTTLTTLFGFLPLALGLGEGAEVRAPMAITVIGGLTVSTLLTLLVIPVVYDLLDRRGDAWYTERRRLAERSEALAQGDEA